ncbi:expressed protein [Phakopsora pachyrhizi]|uniref:Expressed protein n=1 Tax=Phakopsora pachyrhizi TaxID=170000 RepID=A0AAV0BLS9_PHAPC|nr:expressed protein [Phakopsora pachyrhizi]
MSVIKTSTSKKKRNQNQNERYYYQYQPAEYQLKNQSVTSMIHFDLAEFKIYYAIEHNLDVGLAGIKPSYLFHSFLHEKMEDDENLPKFFIETRYFPESALNDNMHFFSESDDRESQDKNLTTSESGLNKISESENCISKTLNPDDSRTRLVDGSRQKTHRTVNIEEELTDEMKFVCPSNNEVNDQKRAKEVTFDQVINCLWRSEDLKSSELKLANQKVCFQVLDLMMDSGSIDKENLKKTLRSEKMLGLIASHLDATIEDNKPFYNNLENCNSLKKHIFNETKFQHLQNCLSVLQKNEWIKLQYCLIRIEFLRTKSLTQVGCLTETMNELLSEFEKIGINFSTKQFFNEIMLSFGISTNQLVARTESSNPSSSSEHLKFSESVKIDLIKTLNQYFHFRKNNFLDISKSNVSNRCDELDCINLSNFFTKFHIKVLFHMLCFCFCNDFN